MRQLDSYQTYFSNSSVKKMISKSIIFRNGPIWRRCFGDDYLALSCFGTKVFWR